MNQCDRSRVQIPVEPRFLLLFCLFAFLIPISIRQDRISGAYDLSFYNTAISVIASFLFRLSFLEFQCSGVQT